MINASRIRKQKRVRNFFGLCLIAALLPALRGYAPAFQQPAVAHAASHVQVSAQPSLLALSNQQRHQNGIEALAPNEVLDRAAQAKAEDMVARDYWSHTTPDGNEPWVFITRAGYSYSYAGENLAYGFSDDSKLVSGWMNSESHRKNLLSENYSEVGFGSAVSQNFLGEGTQTIVVALYASPR